MTVLDAAAIRFISARRRAILATVAPGDQPRLVPICFVLSDAGTGHREPALYSPIDEKPKRSAEPRDLARVRDILERPGVSLLFEHWSEDWSELAWLRAYGTAVLLEADDDAEAHGRVVAELRSRYPQYRSQAIDAAPLIRVTIERVRRWQARPTPGPSAVTEPSS